MWRTDREADPISENLTRRGARWNVTDARARRYALRTVQPSPARREAPEPDAWLPILDLTAELEAIDMTGELELIALEEGRIDLERELETLEADFWRSAESEHPFLTGVFPAEPTSDTAVPLSIFDPAVPREEEFDRAPTPAPARDFVPTLGQTLARAVDPGAAREHALDPLLVPEEYAQIRPNRPAIVHRRRSLRLRRRVIVTALVVAVSAACVGATAQVIGGTDPRRDVTISIDGQAKTIVTRAGTVGDLLAARGMVVNPGDRVIPSVTTPLHQGMPIRILRSFPVVVDIDGVVSRRRTTHHGISAVRRELKIARTMIAVGGSARVNRGDQLVLRTPHSVSFAVDGTITPLTKVTALTVGELVASRKITLGPTDEMQPAAETRLADGMTVQVFRIGEDEVAEDQLIPFPTEVRDDANLGAGQARTIREGRNGRERVVSKVVKRDGEITQWTEVRREILEPSVPRILARGTKVSGTQSPPPAPATGGRYYQSGTATHYRSHAGAGACAHLTLPFGTVLKLVNTANGKTAQCRVGDRGPQAWTGHVIDLNPDVFQALAPLSAGVISLKIYIL